HRRHGRLLEGQRDRRRARHEVDVQAARGARRRDRRQDPGALSAGRGLDRGREARAALPRRARGVRHPSPFAREVVMFSYTTPVRFADVDHAGIVYYPRFFHMFHLAFEELWRARMGARAYSELLDRERVGFPAVKAECEFRAPLRFGEDAEIQLTISRLG